MEQQHSHSLIVRPLYRHLFQILRLRLPPPLERTCSTPLDSPLVLDFDQHYFHSYSVVVLAVVAVAAVVESSAQIPPEFQVDSSTRLCPFVRRAANDHPLHPLLPPAAGSVVVVAVAADVGDGKPAAISGRDCDGAWTGN